MQRLVLELLHIIRDEKISPNDKPAKLKTILQGIKLQLASVSMTLQAAQRPPLDENALHLMLDTFDPKDQERDTPLLAAARLKDAACLNVILEEKPNLEAKTARGWTALMLATEDPKNPCFPLLLNAGADANAQCDWDGGCSVVMMTAKWGTPQQLEQLAEKKADVTFKNSKGNTALIIAASCKRSDNIHALTKLGAKDEPNHNGITALFLALNTQDALCVSALLLAKSDYNHQSNDGNIPLVVSICLFDLINFTALLNAGADVNQLVGKGNDTYMPLAFALGRAAENHETARFQNCLTMVALLLDANAQPIPYRNRLKLSNRWEDEVYELINRCNQKNSAANFCKGNILERDGDISGAIGYYKLAPEFAPALRRLGELHFQNHPNYAKEFYQQAARLGDVKAIKFCDQLWPKPPAQGVDAKHSPTPGVQQFQAAPPVKSNVPAAVAATSAPAPK